MPAPPGSVRRDMQTRVLLGVRSRPGLPETQAQPERPRQDLGYKALVAQPENNP